MMTLPATTNRLNTQLAGARPTLCPGRLSRTLRCKPVAFKEDDKQQLELGIVDKVKAGLEAVTKAPTQPPKPAEVKVNFLVPAFTRRREIEIGRIAMVSYSVATLLELATRQGPVHCAAATLGTSAENLVGLITIVIIYNLLAIFSPSNPTWSPENLEDVTRRPRGWPSAENGNVNVAQALGITEWGFTKANELFVGRTAMLAWAHSILFEALSGKGPMQQLADILHTPFDDSYVNRIKTVFLLFSIGATGLAYWFDNKGEIKSGNEVY